MNGTKKTGRPVKDSNTVNVSNLTVEFLSKKKERLWC